MRLDPRLPFGGQGLPFGGRVFHLGVHEKRSKTSGGNIMAVTSFRQVQLKHMKNINFNTLEKKAKLSKHSHTLEKKAKLILSKHSHVSQKVATRESSYV